MPGELVIKDKQYIWHPFTPQGEEEEPLLITRGKGSFLYGENGLKYLDAISSWWVNLHGHSHPYISEKIYEQANRLEHVIFAGFTHEPAIHLAERLIDILPGYFSKIFFSDNGSTAVEVALKMAIQFWWNLVPGNGQPKRRNKILAFRNDYHGDTFGAMSVSDRNVFTLPFHGFLFEVLFLETPNENNIDSLLSLIQQEGDEVVCFVYEPLVQGAGGMKMYAASGLDRMLKIAKEKGIICIADEVMTGFGRTGNLFASEYVDEKPDIICLSKGITGGTMALGVTACTSRIHQAYVSSDLKKTFFHGHSFTANPIACTAALASLDLLFENASVENRTRIVRQIDEFQSRLNDTKNGFTDLIKNLRALGTILAFELCIGKDEYLNEVGKWISKRAMENGVFLRPLGNTVYLMPPYCFTKQELDFVFEKLYAILEELVRETDLAHR